MQVPSSAVRPRSDIPFLNVIDPAFDFNAPEVVSARERNWYADSPIGPLVLRYAEAQAMLRDRGWSTTASATWRATASSPVRSTTGSYR